MTREYGFFDSAYSAADAVAGSIEQGQLQADDAGLFWVEFRPEESGRSVLCGRSWDGELRDLTPPGFSVHSRVYEYGGKSWCLLANDYKAQARPDKAQASRQLAFVNGDDQQIWLQSLIDGEPSSPLQLTHEEGCRFGDLLSDSDRQRIIAVQERVSDDPTQPEHALVSVCVATGAVIYLSRGQDFYASPTLNENNDKLAWISWSHPDMPWVRTELHCAELDFDGSLLREITVNTAFSDVVSSTESIQQPRFLADGSLSALSDTSGWWNLYRYHGESESATDSMAENATNHRKEALWPAVAEFGIAQWQLGVSTWDWIKNPTASKSHSDEICLVASYLENGRGHLAIRQVSLNKTATEKSALLALEFELFRHISCFAGKIYCIASSATRTPAVLEISPDFEGSAQVKVLAGNRVISGLEQISRPQSICYPVSGEVAHGFLYLPETMNDTDKKPPLLVFTHGGPTATTYAVFNPKIRYWTERGFAVIDLNYRGSAGFGREYRHRLEGQWGITDVEDVVAAADYLAEQGLTDSRNVFIRGGSAGGYTTLCALAFSDRFRGGASYYGVSDPLTLTRDTHKFESHYLDWLIGDPRIDLKRYQERSPLYAADSISSPMIFFQGGQDKVVVADQTERIVKALQRNAISVEYHCYPEEKHGFRNSENQISSLEAELAFYQALLGT